MWSLVAKRQGQGVQVCSLEAASMKDENVVTHPQESVRFVVVCHLVQESVIFQIFVENIYIHGSMKHHSPVTVTDSVVAGK